MQLLLKLKSKFVRCNRDICESALRLKYSLERCLKLFRLSAH